MSSVVGPRALRRTLEGTRIMDAEINHSLQARLKLSQCSLNAHENLHKQKHLLFSEGETKLNLETEIKLDKLKGLLKSGYSLRDAIREVGVGWKTYYQYEIYVLADPEVPLPEKRMKRLIERWVTHKIDARTLSILLWGINRYAAKELLIRKRRRQLYAREFNQYRKFADELMIKWSYELAQGSFNN